MSELVDISSQFKGLPMGDLIGGPLTAACDAQVRLANATADFIKYVGFNAPAQQGAELTASDTRYATFSFMRNIADPGDLSKVKQEKVDLQVPMLAIVKVPSLSISKVDITFDMEVKSSFTSKESSSTNTKIDAEAKIGWGFFSAKVNVQGSIASSKENTRASDNSARYHVQVLAEDSGMPEGLARVMDILHSAIAPQVG